MSMGMREIGYKPPPIPSFAVMVSTCYMVKWHNIRAAAPNPCRLNLSGS